MIPKDTPIGTKVYAVRYSEPFCDIDEGTCFSDYGPNGIHCTMGVRNRNELYLTKAEAAAHVRKQILEVLEEGQRKLAEVDQILGIPRCAICGKPAEEPIPILGAKCGDMSIYSPCCKCGKFVVCQTCEQGTAPIVCPKCGKYEFYC